MKIAALKTWAVKDWQIKHSSYAGGILLAHLLERVRVHPQKVTRGQRFKRIRGGR